MNSKQSSRFYLYQQIVRAKLFIDNNFADALCLDLIANEAFFSKFHFIRLFKAVYFVTPHQYLTSVRIAKAKILLQTGMSVVEVCNAVGFESTTSFSSLFKELVDTTPSLYKKEQVERRAEIKEMPLKFIPHCFAKECGWE